MNVNTRALGLPVTIACTAHRGSGAGSLHELSSECHATVPLILHIQLRPRTKDEACGLDISLLQPYFQSVCKLALQYKHVHIHLPGQCQLEHRGSGCPPVLLRMLERL